MTSLIAATLFSVQMGPLIPAEITRIHPDAATTRAEELGEQDSSTLTTLLLTQ